MRPHITRMRSKIKSLTWNCPGKYLLLRRHNTAVMCTYITVFCEIWGFHSTDVQDPGLSMIIDSRRFERMCHFHVHGSGRPRILQKWNLGDQGTLVNVAMMGYTMCAEFLCVMHWNIIHLEDQGGDGRIICRCEIGCENWRWTNAGQVRLQWQALV